MGVLYIKNGGAWEPVTMGLPAGGNAGDALVKNSTSLGDAAWSPVIAGNQVNRQTALASNYTFTNAATTPSGFTDTFTAPAGRYLVTASWDVNGSTAPFGRVQGILRVDGVNQTPSLLYDSNGNLFRIIWGLSWWITLTAGSHTIDMQFLKNVATGTATLNATNTQFQIIGP